MRKNTLSKVICQHHGEMIGARNNGEYMYFKEFDEAYAYVTDPIDVEFLGEIDLIEVHGAPPGPQSPGVYLPGEKNNIRKDLDRRVPFKGD